MRFGTGIVGIKVLIDQPFGIPILHFIQILFIFGLHRAVGDFRAPFEIELGGNLIAGIERSDHIYARIIKEQRGLTAVEIVFYIREIAFPIVVGDEVLQFRVFLDDSARFLVHSQPILAHDKPVPGPLFGRRNAVDADTLPAVRLRKFLDAGIAFAYGGQIVGHTLVHVGRHIPKHAVGNALFHAAGIPRAHLNVADHHDVVFRIVARPHLLNVAVNAVYVIDLHPRDFFQLLIDGELIIARISVGNFTGDEHREGVEILLRIFAAA